MLVRIFEGNAWGDSRQLGDFVFDMVPAAGQKLVIATDTGWAVGIVGDVAHRITDAGEPADVALLVGAMVTSDDRSDLPLGGLDRAVSSSTPAPRPGPWR